MGPAFPEGTLPINPVPKEGLLFNATNLVNNCDCQQSQLLFSYVFFFLHSLTWIPVPCLANPSALFCEICFVKWV